MVLRCDAPEYASARRAEITHSILCFAGFHEAKLHYKVRDIAEPGKRTRRKRIGAAAVDQHQRVFFRELRNNFLDARGFRGKVQMARLPRRQ